MEMAVTNMYFKKREEHRVMYKSGGRCTQVDYILCRRLYLKEIGDYKEVTGENIARQNQMVVCRMTLEIKRRKKMKAEPSFKWWKLKKEDCYAEFREELKQAELSAQPPPASWWSPHFRNLAAVPLDHTSSRPLFHCGHNGTCVSTESTPSETADTGFSPEEWARMLKALDWPTPDQPITHIAMTTCPACSTFSIVGQKEKYRVGDELYVHIVAKDHNNTAKRYGGDFFLTKLYSSKLKASVFGEVLDHRNGSYLARLLLPWVGKAQVAVRLVHSSEAIQVFKKYLNSDVVRHFYWGHFEGTGPNGTRIKETVSCNLKWGQADGWKTGNCCCDYRDPRTGDEWQCEKPPTLPCDAWVYHERGGFKNPLTSFEQELLARTLTNQGIKGDNRILNVLPSTANIALKQINMHKNSKTGPRMAVSMDNNIIIRWRSHGLPLSFLKMPVVDLHYISNQIDDLAGGPHTVIVFDIFAHLVFHPLTFYAHRVLKIRQAVLALLNRAPQTKVIIKSGNTGGSKDIYANDWYYIQLNIIMREAFRDLPVIYMDVFQMTSCHYARENIHPPAVIIANEIDIFLSFVCPI
ncbi:NXPE family member 3-like [Chanos chanos]|uniref:NXPE family member 3-like n=1 Tax=Chanos chanos TaxID=29144 RepID=A0A6J2UTS9_CHACN|nr:NXPE family member 3-like [Chanos chanos]